MTIFVSILVFLLRWNSLLAQETWTYEDEDPLGPSHWGEAYPTCNGAYQSPINLDRSSTVALDGHLDFVEPLWFHDYSVNPLSTTFHNRGHYVSVQMSFPEGYWPRMTGGPFDNETYVLDSLHCHWSHESNDGSEHTIDGVGYAMECHAVHANLKYGTYDNAMNYADGIAVLGFLYEEDDSTTNSWIFQGMANTSTFDQENYLSGGVGVMGGLKVTLEHEYFNYFGSLTTPGCNEIVTWIVYDHIFNISTDQLSKIREFHDERDLELEDNTRPTQKLNDRTVYRISYSQLSTGSTASQMNSAIFLLFIVLYLCFKK